MRIADPLSVLWSQQHRHLELLWESTFRSARSQAFFCGEFEEHRQMELKALFLPLRRCFPALEQPFEHLQRASARLASCARRVCTLSQRKLLGQALQAQSRREEEILRPYLVDLNARRQLPFFAVEPHISLREWSEALEYTLWIFSSEKFWAGTAGTSFEPHRGISRS